jgi:hypothetical protein
MTRLGSLTCCALLGTGLLACGSNSTSPTKDPLDLVPADKAVSGWTVDQAHSKAPGERAMTATSEKQTEALIDGGSENYFQEPYLPKMFIWQNYLNSTLSAAPDGATVKLYIFKMASADQAKGIYTSILQRPGWGSRTGMPDDWQAVTPTLGTESRLQDTASQWWINFHQDVFYVEILLAPSYGPPPEFTPANADTKQEAVRFARAVAAKI